MAPVLKNRCISSLGFFNAEFQNRACVATFTDLMAFDCICKTIPAGPGGGKNAKRPRMQDYI